MTSLSIKEAEDIFINALRCHLSDSAVLDINGSSVGTRASKSYWIGKGWATEEGTGLNGQSRWATWGLPQVQVFNINTTLESEGVEGEQYWSALFQVDIFASGEGQKLRLANEARNILGKEARRSTSASGLKIDSIINEFDAIADERIPQDIFRRSITFRTYYRANRSGS